MADSGRRAGSILCYTVQGSPALFVKTEFEERMKMTLSTLSEIEDGIRQLSFREQMRLLEWLAATLRRNASSFYTDHLESKRDDLLAMMADDPEMQAEMAAINAEFAIADFDGLENL